MRAPLLSLAKSIYYANIKYSQCETCMYFLTVSSVGHYLTHQEKDSALGFDYYQGSTDTEYDTDLVVTHVNCMVGYKVSKDI